MTQNLNIQLPGYVIHNQKTCMFSRGGDRIGKNPKIWNNLGHVKNHLNLAIYMRYGEYKDLTKPHVISIQYPYCKDFNQWTVYNIHTNQIEFMVSDYYKQKTEALKNEDMKRYSRECIVQLPEES